MVPGDGDGEQVTFPLFRRAGLPGLAHASSGAALSLRGT